MSQEDKMCIHESEAKCKDSDSKDVDSSYCKNRPNYELVNITSTGNISFVRTNRKNAVSISKTDITGEEELYGARMKICTTKPDEKLDCDLATITMSGQCSTSDLENGTCKNVDDTTMEQSIIWTSGIAPKTWRGLVTNKEYYLVETVAPLGYKISQYTSFSIKEDGTVISSDTTVQDEKILVKNDLTDLTVVKQDSKTKKELSGAKLLLCMMGEDENGKMKIIKPEEGTGCVVASLNDGTLAEWTTDGKPINITGLAAGTYTLTEEEAPDDYDMAEDIVFTLRQDGTLVDANDKVIKDNKIIMYDDEMEQVPTGDVLIIVIAILAIVSLGGGMFYYQKYYKKKKLA